MKMDSVSTVTLGQVARTAISEIQSQLKSVQEELTTGKHDDLGLEVGSQSARVTALRREFERLNNISTGNGMANLRLEISQNALGQMSETAQNVRAALVAMDGQASGRTGIVEEARAALASLMEQVNVTANGAYVFAGVNSDAKPLEDYLSNPPSAARLAVVNAFTTEFGVAPGDPAAANIDPNDMAAFLSGGYDAEFSDANWSANWSSAADKNVRTRITSTALVETSANANEAAFRDLAKAYASIIEFGESDISDAAFEKVVGAATSTLSDAIGGVSNVQAKLGATQERIKQADVMLEQQRNLISGGITNLEDVDPYEASMRATELMTHLETTYALTARLQRLALVNYL